MHDACMVCARDNVEDFVDEELSFLVSERWTLLLGVPVVAMRPDD